MEIAGLLFADSSCGGEARISPQLGLDFIPDDLAFCVPDEFTFLTAVVRRLFSVLDDLVFFTVIDDLVLFSVLDLVLFSVLDDLVLFSVLDDLMLFSVLAALRFLSSDLRPLSILADRDFFSKLCVSIGGVNITVEEGLFSVAGSGENKLFRVVRRLPPLSEFPPFSSPWVRTDVSMDL